MKILERNELLSKGVRLADVPEINIEATVEEDIKKYGWKMEKGWLLNRLHAIWAQLIEHYDLELAYEKQALYLINDCYIKFV